MWATPAVAAGERSLVDRPDELFGPQVHVVYAVPADGVDRRLDVDGTLTRSVASWTWWLTGQTGGRALTIDTAAGEPDVTFVRLERGDASITSEGAYVRDVIERELVARGLTRPGKLYAVYYDGGSTWSCGGGAWPPVLPGVVGAMYLRGLPNYVYPCASNAFGQLGAPGYLEYAMLHELVHTLGYASSCAPHHWRAGHVSDAPNDLMWSGDVPWRFPAVLDVGRDDYYGAGLPGCPDLSASGYLARAARVTISVRGSLTVRADGWAVPERACAAPSCVLDVPVGTRLRLRADDDRARWGAPCPPAAASECAVTVAGETSIAVQRAARTVALSVRIRGSGIVRLTPSGLCRRATCRFGFREGTAVALRPVPARGKRFLGWSRTCSGAVCRIRLDRSRTVTAVFTR